MNIAFAMHQYIKICNNTHSKTNVMLAAMTIYLETFSKGPLARHSGH